MTDQLTADSAEPAAAYVRMSTEHQRYSIENQLAVISGYALSRGMRIVAQYSDPGRSGVTLKGRPGLSSLLQHVLAGDHAFSAVLVLDVSRWGRFQDIDESAHYEFLLKRAGVRVIYCAEAFENDGSSISSIIKALKRSMAGEYSRELSAKVRVAQRTIAAKGYWVGGPPAYGLRRLAFDAEGRPWRQLAPEERKPHPTSHVRLIAGPADEVAAVRRAFEMFAVEKRPYAEIIAWLNAEAPPRAGGRPWKQGTVSSLLRNEAYIGRLVFHKSSHNLGRRSVVPREQWGRSTMGEPVIEPNLFRAAQDRIDSKSPSRSLGRIERQLMAVLKREGRLSRSLIDRTPNCTSSRLIVERFGGMRNAYSRLGWSDGRDYGFVARHRAAIPIRNAERDWLVVRLKALGFHVVHDGGVIRTANGLSVTVGFCIGRLTDPGRVWALSAVRPGSSDYRAVIRLCRDDLHIIDRHLIPRAVLKPRTWLLRSSGWSVLEQYKCEDFSPVLSLALGVGLEDALSAARPALP